MSHFFLPRPFKGGQNKGVKGPGWGFKFIASRPWGFPKKCSVGRAEKLFILLTFWQKCRKKAVQNFFFISSSGGKGDVKLAVFFLQ